jgi:hypothetical protein
MGVYARGWAHLPTPNLDALPGKLDRIANKLAAKDFADDVADAEIIRDAVKLILGMHAGLSVVERSLATRSKPAKDDVKAVLAALNTLESNKVALTGSKYSSSMVTIGPVIKTTCEHDLLYCHACKFYNDAPDQD